MTISELRYFLIWAKYEGIDLADTTEIELDNYYKDYKADLEFNERGILS